MFCLEFIIKLCNCGSLQNQVQIEFKQRCMKMNAFFYFYCFFLFDLHLQICQSVYSLTSDLFLFFTLMFIIRVFMDMVITAHCICVQSDFNAFKHVRYVAHSNFSTQQTETGAKNVCIYLFIVNVCIYLLKIMININNNNVFLHQLQHLTLILTKKCSSNNNEQ